MLVLVCLTKGPDPTDRVLNPAPATAGSHIPRPSQRGQTRLGRSLTMNKGNSSGHHPQCDQDSVSRPHGPHFNCRVVVRTTQAQNRRGGVGGWGGVDESPTPLCHGFTVMVRAESSQSISFSFPVSWSHGPLVCSPDPEHPQDDHENQEADAHHNDGAVAVLGATGVRRTGRL